MDKFSVAISVYKNDVPEHFDTALASITTEQTVKPDEIVLIVDGPVPNGVNLVIDKYTELYPDMFQVVRLKKNGGLGNALRLAVEKANNELIARMDSDDIALPNRFEQQLMFFNQNPELDIVGGDITEFIGEPCNIVGKRMVPQNDEDIKVYMKVRCAMNHMTVMYKKSAVLKAGNYIDWFYNEDYYLWIRMQQSGCNFANIGSVLVNVRTGTDMYQRRGGKKYFQSEKRLQDYMLDQKMISRSTYCLNVIKRWVVQIALPNSVRGWVFKTFARSRVATKVDNVE